MVETMIIRPPDRKWFDHVSGALGSPGVRGSLSGRLPSLTAMATTALRLAIVIVTLVTTSVFAVQRPPRAPKLGPDSPEPVIRAFYRSVLSGDAATYHKVIVVDPLADRFLPRDAPAPEKAHEIAMGSIDFSMRQTQPFRARGEEVGVDATGHYPVGTTARYLANFPHSLTVVTVVRKADGWRVDLRWWEALAMLTEDGPPPGSAEYAVKRLTAALVTLRRDEARKVIVPDGQLEVLFAGAPSAPEPSDQMISLVGEMAVVEIGPGEFVKMPSGAIVEGVNDPARKVLVGLYGPNELPFVVRKAGAEWRVGVEPYFSVIEW
jgi:hypothetical protein